MARHFQTHFTTGEFSRLCGVSKRTLFHYDDIGLFQPAIKDNNGYRLYTYQQLNVFYNISIFKELNIPLKEVKKHLDERTPELIIDLSKTKIKEINDEMERLNHIKNSLENSISYISQGLEADLTKIIIEEQEQEEIILSELINIDAKDYIKWAIDYMDFESNTALRATSFVGQILTKDTILKRAYDNVDYFFVKAKSIEPNIEVTTKPKGLYAVAYHHGDYETIGKTYDNMIAFLKRNNLEMKNFAYEDYLIDEFSVRNAEDYVTKITMDIKATSE